MKNPPLKQELLNNQPLNQEERYNSFLKLLVVSYIAATDILHVCDHVEERTIHLSTRNFSTINLSTRKKVNGHCDHSAVASCLVSKTRKENGRRGTHNHNSTDNLNEERE
ncbi:hypothetical protein NE237_011160 [Protea cynaroides]|uniref:Uncharacterized protein n=1 Tax=Protea cynaroides TaxID=273540 RepID=A0A9Q0JWR6_9MAGN|nr:hypothetical protein NE237_011160 [Protea cynaroides]